MSSESFSIYSYLLNVWERSIVFGGICESCGDFRLLYKFITTDHYASFQIVYIRHDIFTNINSNSKSICWCIDGVCFGNRFVALLIYTSVLEKYRLVHILNKVVMVNGWIIGINRLC